MQYLRRLWAWLNERPQLIADPDCGDCYGRGFDAGGQQCVCVREIRVGRGMAGKPDGHDLAACAVCGTIRPRARALRVTPTLWACGGEHADQIANEQAW